MGCLGRVIATPPNADLLSKEGRRDPMLNQRFYIKSFCDSRLCLAPVLWVPRTASPFPTIAQATPCCHCSSPQPDGQLCGGRHCDIPCLYPLPGWNRRPKAPDVVTLTYGSIKGIGAGHVLIATCFRNSNCGIRCKAGGGRTGRRLLQ